MTLRIIRTTAPVAASLRSNGVFLVGIGCSLAVRATHGQAPAPTPFRIGAASGRCRAEPSSTFHCPAANGRAGEPGVREFPPTTTEWEAKYKRKSSW